MFQGTTSHQNCLFQILTKVLDKKKYIQEALKTETIK